MGDPMKLGLMGGTFDPIHVGHLLAAETVVAKLQLDQVMFVPAGMPWMKEGTEISPACHRVKMTSLAVSDNPRFSVSSIEVDREGPTYTVDTLEELTREDPLRELFLIVGADAVEKMDRWKDPGRILELCTVVAVPRPGYCASAGLSGQKGSDRIIYLESPQTAVSATEVRERVSRGLSVADSVPEAVEAYIRQHGLYQPASATGNLNAAEVQS